MSEKKNNMYMQANMMKHTDWDPLHTMQLDENEMLRYEEIPAPVNDMSYSMPNQMAAPMPEYGLCTTPVMAFVPVQRWGETYEGEQGLERGTIFPELDLPFLGKGQCPHE